MAVYYIGKTQNDTWYKVKLLLILRVYILKICPWVFHPKFRMYLTCIPGTYGVWETPDTWNYGERRSLHVGPSRRAVSTLNCWAISCNHKFTIFKLSHLTLTKYQRLLNTEHYTLEYTSINCACNSILPWVGLTTTLLADYLLGWENSSRQTW